MPHTLTEEENKKIFEERFLPCINELIRTNQDIYEKYNTNIAYQDITPQFILYAIVRDKFDSKQNQNKTSNSIGSSKFVYDLCEGDIFLVNVLDYLRISMEDTIKHSNLKKNPNNNISSIENSFDDDYHLKKQSRKKKTTNPEIINNLKAYGDFLTDKTYKFNPAVGREKELKALMLAVATPKKSAVITGKAGVGKTALVEGLAYLIQTKQAPKLFEKKK